MEIDVWDGDPDSSDSESSNDSSSDSDNEKSKSSAAKIKEKIDSGSENGQQQSKGLSRSVSTRLSDALRRKTTKKPDPTTSKANANDAKAEHDEVLVEPRVLHGRTLTKGTSFREIAYAIRDSAFVTSDLPVIVSFEVHCSLEQQQIMVDIMRDAWKGLLVEVSPDLAADKLPKLADLKRKILIKTKSMPLTSTNTTPETSETSPERTVPQPAGAQQQKPAKPIKILEALAKMAIYTRAYHFNHFDQPGKISKQDKRRARNL